MASRNKGFDPLSSLFEAPDPKLGVPLPDVDEEEDEDVVDIPSSSALGLTDPMQGRQAPPLPASTDELDPPDAVQDKQALAKQLAAQALARAQALKAEAVPTPPPPRKAAPRTEPEPEEDKQALAKRLAAEALARAQAAAPAPAPAAPAEDKVALAKRLAEQAMAKAAAAAPPEPPADKKAAPTKAERKKKARSRVDALAARARKPLSALEAARAAARDEEEREVQARRRKENELRDVVQDLIPAWLPGCGTVYVANAIAVKDRHVMAAVWKAHRSKFLADGQLERAVGAAAVLAALEQSEDGHLVAAHAVTDASDYLVWLDLGKNSLVAAFADARAYFAQAG
ncbi:MAG: hypothetical protein H6742_04745 [Alphaproteobacteria bacterium]|nr:hypothetical protein [Alphaproteobacteria bacterium]